MRRPPGAGVRQVLAVPRPGPAHGRRRVRTDEDGRFDAYRQFGLQFDMRRWAVAVRMQGGKKVQPDFVEFKRTQAGRCGNRTGQLDGGIFAVHGNRAAYLQQRCGQQGL